MGSALGAQQDVIHQVVLLLPTIEEALFHMKQQLSELRLEESASLFNDIELAVGDVTHPGLRAATPLKRGLRRAAFMLV